MSEHTFNSHQKAPSKLLPTTTSNVYSENIFFLYFRYLDSTLNVRRIRGPLLIKIKTIISRPYNKIVPLWNGHWRGASDINNMGRVVIKTETQWWGFVQHNDRPKVECNEMSPHVKCSSSVHRQRERSIGDQGRLRTKGQHFTIQSLIRLI